MSYHVFFVISSLILTIGRTAQAATSGNTDPNQAFLMITIGNLARSYPPEERQAYLLTLRQAIRQMQARPNLSPARRHLLTLMLQATHYHLAQTVPTPTSGTITHPPAQRIQPPIPAHVMTMISLINQRRHMAGIPPLTINPTLTTVAQTYAQTLVSANLFSHTGPDGKKVTDRVRDAGYRFQKVAENLANTPDAEEAFELLRNSPGHRANILNPMMTELGIARHDSIRVQIFARPLE